MRDAFAKALRSLSEHEQVVLITGDLGFGVFDDMANAKPQNFLNAGITEQSMTSLAAGMADEGWIPFVYSIANFPTLRNLEQIRNDIAYPKRHVVICSVGAGLAYGSLGFSHFGVEDISILRALPNMRLLTPSDPIRASLATESALSINAPTYLRLGKSGEANFGDKLQFEHKEIRKIFDAGSHRAIVSTGSIGIRVNEVNSSLSDPIDHYSAEEIWPPTEAMRDLLTKHSEVIIVEEHSKVGGLFSIFAELKSEKREGAKLKSLSVNRDSLMVSGGHDYMLDLAGLALRDIRDAIEGIEN